MHILYIGGTGEISRACVDASIEAGHQVTVFNRARTQQSLSEGVNQVVGDLADDATYQALGARHFDVVCQFLAYDPAAVQRDVDTFAGKCDQYLFISTASAYEKPSRSHVITENTPLANSFWAYSRSKAKCETLLRNTTNLHTTIVRPSHTYRTRYPSTVIHGDHLAWRISQGKPVIVHGDGESLWTLTHARDFAAVFVALFGHAQAQDETFHITSDSAQTWNTILRAVASCMGQSIELVPVTSRTLVAHNPDWIGPLLGDKSNSVCFDNTKIKRLAPDWQCQIPLQRGLELTKRFVDARLTAGYQPDAELDRQIDRIIELA